ncbi:BadF/BadG/BcrA/BcrD ATPase family protein [Metabacillus indicus]|uniref:N-acetylglucosamine kinase n=1 Tax=Metabacillus indicus TaxID=246786 RepID=UPI002A08152C|nr:BadF/BadG/BcrA/BcrD ATPase family protein [Metabacillus indicus]MDX8288706.1 BadF/BadG/BcrA/BcrD ATPase family protein [Metabacillus indicus]
MDYIIGVDGGGTKTEAVAYDLYGNKLNEANSGFGNLLIDEAKAIENIIQAIQDCIEPFDKRNCRYICIGLAGFGGVENPLNINNALKEAFSVPFTIFNDGVIAHAASLKGQEGILTISGTGSVSFGIKNGVERMAGGWGHLLGDEGSGYWIAMQAFIKMTDEEDRGFPYSPLTEEILSVLGYNRASGIKKFIYKASKTDIAAFAPIIVKHAQLGDAFACSLLENAGFHLAKTTLNVCNTLNFPQNVTIAIKGSILTNIEIVQDSFVKHLKQSKPEANIITEEVSSTLGCYYLALKVIGT